MLCSDSSLYYLTGSQCSTFSRVYVPTAAKKRRKSRTAFTNRQLFELEHRFRRQKYLLPVDRDSLALDLGLTNAQVITWFQNRRAKLKRDLDELRADMDAVRSLEGLGKICLEGSEAELRNELDPCHTRKGLRYSATHTTRIVVTMHSNVPGDHV